MHSITEVQYFCPCCDTEFVVYHRTEERNESCYYCGTEVSLTGYTAKIDGEFIVRYLNGEEVGREPRPN